MLQNKTFTKILSILIAITLWSYVVTVENPTTQDAIKNVPVQILNEENLTQRGLTITGDRNFVVTVTVEGRRAEVKNLKAEDILVQADVFGRTAGENQSVVLEVTLPESVKTVSGKTPRITLNIEELVSVYKPINVQFTGQFKKGTEPGAVTVQPEEIEVKGAKSLVETVAYVRAEIDAAGVTEDGLVETVAAVPMNSAGEVVENVKLSSATVDISAKLSYTKEVPLKVEIVGQVGADYELVRMNIPQTVTIKGSRADLEKVTEITARDVNLSDVTATSKLPLKFDDLPQGIELANTSKDLGISVTIKGLSTGEIEINSEQIQVLQLEDGKTAYINTDSVKITVTGHEALVQGLTAEDFTLSVNAQGLTPGSHPVPLKVESGKAFTNITVIPEEVYITINEAS